jgi:hypothetical protein
MISRAADLELRQLEAEMVENPTLLYDEEAARLIRTYLSTGRARASDLGDALLSCLASYPTRISCPDRSGADAE